MGTTAAAAVAFIALALAVHAGLMRGPDLAAALDLRTIANPFLDAIAAAISIAFAFEAVTLYAVLAALLLWRRGAGIWSLVPFSFMALTAVELAFKLLMPTDPIPQELHRSVFYPLTEVAFAGSFPSGHALRIGFLGMAAAWLIPTPRLAERWLLRIAIAAVTVFGALSRVYLGVHWLSDVLAGLILGGAVGILMAQSISTARVRRQSADYERALQH